MTTGQGRSPTRSRPIGPAALLLLSLAASGSPPCGAQEEAPYRLERLSPRVVVALQPHENRFNDSNATILLADDGVIVVDAQTRPAAVRWLRERIAELSDLPIRTLIFTHWHGDHTQAASVYREAGAELEIIGHETLLEDIPQRARPGLADSIERWRAAIGAAEKRLDERRSIDGAPLDDAAAGLLAEQIADTEIMVAGLEALEIPAPDVAFRQRLHLHRRGLELDLYHRPGHTRGDIVIHLPSESLLLGGDLIDEVPYAGHGSPSDWLRSLDALAALEFDRVVPGHGPVLPAPESVHRTRDLLLEVKGQVAATIKAGHTLAESQMLVDLAAQRELHCRGDATAERNFDGMMPALVERWYEELQQAPDP